MTSPVRTVDELQIMHYSNERFSEALSRCTVTNALHLGGSDF